MQSKSYVTSIKRKFFCQLISFEKLLVHVVSMSSLGCFLGYQLESYINFSKRLRDGRVELTDSADESASHLVWAVLMIVEIASLLNIAERLVLNQIKLRLVVHPGFEPVHSP